ncbi:metallophosphoesterase family protein [Microvirga pudoricolor]|uniref:metallophosphoesterase family protein n=1 Tax=Microvirga pudoricolor TaxID=2778729 RepID=UPI0019500FA1|nr:metallophosphoesterase family protein [Microvirga pudoricolor]MBM6593385.1 metallophosphoesterase family protein [Microvirga pudoricolor]
MRARPSETFAAISDVHGNSDALRAVLDDIDRIGITAIVNLGDHLSGPLAAREVADLLMTRDMACIRGNHDRWLVEMEPSAMGPSDRAAHRQLDPAHLEWLRGLPATGRYGRDVFLCHGTPDSDTAYWMEEASNGATLTLKPSDGIEAIADGIDAALILCGHTHIPRALRLRDGRLIVSPGSVGCPAYSDDAPFAHVMQTATPDACYAVLEKRHGRWAVSFRYVPYDSGRMVGLARESGREDWASALATGWIRP